MPFRRYPRSLFGKLFAGLCCVIFLTGASVWLIAYTAQMRQAEEVGGIEWRFMAYKSLDTAMSIYQYAGRDQLIAWLRDPRLNTRPTVFLVNARGQELSGRAVPERAMVMLADIKTAPSDNEPSPRHRALRTIEINGEPWDVFAVRTDSFPIRLIPPGLSHFPLAAALSLALFFTFVIAWFLAHFYTRDIKKLNNAMRRFANGDFETRVAKELAGGDSEVASLARVFDAMADRISQLISRQRRLFHDVSHEVRSPLARIDVALELARRDQTRIPVSLERIQKEVETVDALIDELLTYARLDTDTEFPNEPVGLRDIMESVAEDLCFEAQKKRVRVETDFSGDPIIEADGALLARAFENLTRNALRYSPEGGVIYLSLSEDSNGYVLRCRDEGKGMPDAELDTMFNPFVRGSSEATGSGFGLGLAIAKRAVMRHGGTICARNASPGLEITVTLPRPERPIVL